MEFKSQFTAQLYCRVFIANQTIIKKGEYFAEMYLIFNGSVTLSLDVKDVAEYFRLYQSNYFGDYQIILGHRSSEHYKSSVDSPTYCFCLKKKTFLGLMEVYPEAKRVFTERAELRRIEFRRIKRQFHNEAEIDFAKNEVERQKIMNRDVLTVNDGLPDEEGNRKPSSKFNTYEYDGAPEKDEFGNEAEGQE